jgi:GABA(A) receptor-associated protein
MRFKFKEENSFDQRLADSRKIRQKYNERIPVIVEKNPGSNVPDIDKHKFLVPSDITVAQFLWIIRKRIELDSEKALHIYFGNTMPQSSSTMGQLYDQLKDEDGFLYASYSGENSFGC